MRNHILLLVAGVSACLAIAFATNPVQKVPLATSLPPDSCPVPSEEMLRCIRRWACQYIIRLDLRCLLNLNGNPLLGGVLGGSGTSPVTGVGSTPGGGGGILGGILGI